MLSLATAMAWRGDTLHVFLAICCLVYLGATLLFARNLHRLLTESLRTGFVELRRGGEPKAAEVARLAAGLRKIEAADATVLARAFAL